MAGARIWHHSNGPGPISVIQFFRKLQQVWHGSRLTWQRDLPQRLGVAVSGGADSMALAHLCQQLESSRLIDQLTVKAFIVDHGAREKSAREARTVAGWLADMGMQSEILELDWPVPSKLSAFETHARRLRFQTLGRACRDSLIDTLLMGHHQDDDVETSLLRLCSGARCAGLSGIPEIARIPECHGIYGVSESGSHFILKSQMQGDRPSRRGVNPGGNDPHFRLPSGCEQQLSTGDISISTGGVLICRPLLSFPKSCLLDTCNSNNIPFVTDTTNFDVTLTLRNAVRSLISSNKLPRALRTPSVLRLIGRSRNLLRESISSSNGLLRKCTVHRFNPRSGWMVLQFPALYYQPNGIGVDKKMERERDIQAVTLRRITELLSPFEENHFPLKSFESASERTFIHYPDGLSGKIAPHSEGQAFTVGGLMFRPVQQAKYGSDMTTTRWLVSRQPYMRHRLPKIRLDASIPWDGTDATYTNWVLWDNRYWFRVKVIAALEGAFPPLNLGHRYLDQFHSDDGNKAHTSTSELLPQTVSLVIKPLERSDLQGINRALDCLALSPAGKRKETARRRIVQAGHGSSKKSRLSVGGNVSKIIVSSAQLRQRLAREAPNDIRFTLPLLAVDRGFGHDELPIALPTIAVRIAAIENALCYGNRLWRVKWEWMHKRIDPEPLQLMSWLDDRNVCKTEPS